MFVREKDEGEEEWECFDDEMMKFVGRMWYERYEVMKESN